MNWFSLAVLSGFFFAASRVVSRLFLKKAGNPLAFTAIHDLIAGLVILPFIFINLHFPKNNITWLYFIGLVLFVFLADWLAFVALRKIDVSLYQIVNQVRHFFILLGGLVFFGESITTFKLVAIIFIILGVVVAIYEENKLIWNRYVWVTILSTLFAVIAFIFVKFTVRDFSETASASLELIAAGLLSWIFLKFDFGKIYQEIKINKWGLVIAGTFFGAFELILFFALNYGEASRVIPVTQSSLIFSVLGGILLLGERQHLTRKILGTILIICGIVLLNYF